MSEKPTLVVGDVHGHFDRLEALLRQEGIIGFCVDCDGTGDILIPGNFYEGREDDEIEECPDCHGDGQRRINHDVRVIQLGDLGHFGGSSGSPTGDKMCYLYAPRWFDLVLWGNHDRALVDPWHQFGGYMHPGSDTMALINLLKSEGKMKMAASAHGYLICHAGVHLGFSHLAKGTTAEGFANSLNVIGEAKLDGLPNVDFRTIDGISRARGGRSDEGGVLWMDWNSEKHLQGDPFKYICGHTADRDGLVRDDEWGNWNIDIGGKYQARLAGLWLEEGKDPRPVKVEL